MDGKGLRERKCKELHKDHDHNDHNDEVPRCSEKEEENKKICGRTPDGTGKISTLIYKRARRTGQEESRRGPILELLFYRGKQRTG